MSAVLSQNQGDMGERKRRHVQILSDTVIDQIAAGEVIERPSSVVKELVENSIDAEASEVTVVIANGGRTNIEIVDNGFGMSREDAVLAIERFGTSKIEQTSDLLSIASLGFRGEALSSIASVSKFRLATSLDGESGTEILIDGGKIIAVNEVSLPRGTRISVRELFYNVPARRRFLRTERTELGYIRTLIGDLAVAYPEVRFRMLADGQEVEHFPPTKVFFERAKQLRLSGENPIEVNKDFLTDSQALSVTGLLTEPLGAVSSASRLRLIINGRSVRDRLLLRAVRDAYGGFLKPGKHPAGILLLQISPQEVDVNVHPQKAEVRFRNGQTVFSRVRDAVSSALTSRGVQSQLNPEGVFSSSVGGGAVFPSQGKPQGQQVEFFGGEVSRVSGEEMLKDPPSSEALSSMRYLGQILHCYLLFEGRAGLSIVDMHAAHERITYYQLKKQFEEQKIVSQALLVPEVIELARDRAARFEDLKPHLEALGFECEDFEGESVVVRAVPAVLARISPKEIITDLLACSDASDWRGVVDKQLDGIIARLACHGSIRSGRELKPEEVYALLETLEEVESSAYCPHGRPVVFTLSESELEGRFGRA